jgi:hypothetical protein
MHADMPATPKINPSSGTVAQVAAASKKRLKQNQ